MGIGSIGTIVVKKIFNLSFNNEISIIDTISLILSVCMSLYIVFILEVRKNRNEHIREIFISYFNQYNSDIRIEIEKMIEDSSYEFTKMTSFFKVRRKMIDYIDALVTENNMKQDIEGIQSVKETMKQLKDVVTNVGCRVENGSSYPIYANAKKHQIRMILSELEHNTYKTIFDINNSL